MSWASCHTFPGFFAVKIFSTFQRNVQSCTPFPLAKCIFLASQDRTTLFASYMLFHGLFWSSHIYSDEALCDQVLTSPLPTLHYYFHHSITDLGWVFTIAEFGHDWDFMSVYPQKAQSWAQLWSLSASSHQVFIFCSSFQTAEKSETAIGSSSDAKNWNKVKEGLFDAPHNASSVRSPILSTSKCHVRLFQTLSTIFSIVWNNWLCIFRGIKAIFSMKIKVFFLF